MVEKIIFERNCPYKRTKDVENGVIERICPENNDGVTLKNLFTC